MLPVSSLRAVRETLKQATVVTTRHETCILLETVLSHIEKHAIISNLSAVTELVLKWKVWAEPEGSAGEPAIKARNLSLVPRARMMEGENQPPQIVPDLHKLIEACAFP